MEPNERDLRLVVTGGGTGGHVVPCLPVIALLRKRGWKTYYIGSGIAMELELLSGVKLEYFSIPSGKIARNRKSAALLSAFKIARGILQSMAIFRKARPQVVFSKGGYIAAPVALAAQLCRVPLVIHESDLTLGLTNRLSVPICTTICTSFEGTIKSVAKYARSKVALTGMPFREQILHGNAERARQLCSFRNDRPVVLIMGGSLGSVTINNAVRAAIPKLASCIQIAHLTGKGKSLPAYNSLSGYKQIEFSLDIHDLLAMADVVVSRAGGTAITEILALKKPNVLIPLPKGVSRGEQVENGRWCHHEGVSYVIEDENLSAESLVNAILQTLYNKKMYSGSLSRLNFADGTYKVCAAIEKAAETALPPQCPTGKTGSR